MPAPFFRGRHSAINGIFLFLLLLCPLLRADTPTTQPTQAFFWKVTSPTTTVYFLGSIHVASKDMYPLPPEIEAAFKNASTLVVELDITQINQMQVAMQVMQKGMYPPGDSLDKHVSPETMKSLQDLCKEVDVPPEAIMQMKPGLASLTLVAEMLKKMGMDPDEGIDKHFLDIAHKPDAEPAKKIVELETMDQQLSLIFDLEDKLAEASLKDDLKGNAKEELTKLFDAWKAGDVKTVEKLLLDDAKDENSKKLMQKMLYDRNIEMTKKITELLAGSQPVFVVVGAAHLIGDQGILKKLEQQNFKVERPPVTHAPAPASQPGNP